MIEIVLHNGIVLTQDSDAGWNLPTPEAIDECLTESGTYRLVNELGVHALKRHEVKEVRYKNQ